MVDFLFVFFRWIKLFAINSIKFKLIFKVMKLFVVAIIFSAVLSPIHKSQFFRQTWRNVIAFYNHIDLRNLFCIFFLFLYHFEISKCLTTQPFFSEIEFIEAVKMEKRTLLWKHAEKKRTCLMCLIEFYSISIEK